MTNNTPELIESLLVPAEKLWRAADLSAVREGRQQSEAEIPLIIGQSRAVQALETGLGIRKPTYHIYVAGIEGTGRRSYVEARCKALAKQMPTPNDQVFVYNFDQPLAPQRIPLPAGEGRYFATAMERFLEAAGNRLQEAFEQETFARQRGQLASAFQEQEQQLWQQAQQQAEAFGFRVIRREDGIATVPLDATGQPYQEEAYEQLSQEEREIMEDRGRQLREQLRDLFQRYRDLQRTMQKRLEELRQRAAG
ncbi:MAG: AAA family ATPase [Firmicutes bacterium]|nr:AAA family ATPase [Bacillota bacterium]